MVKMRGGLAAIVVVVSEGNGGDDGEGGDGHVRVMKWRV